MGLVLQDHAQPRLSRIGAVSRFAALAFAFSLLAQPGQAQQGGAAHFAVGAWQGSAFPAEAGAPAGCIATARFSNGDAIDVILFTNDVLGIAISGAGGLPAWVPPGATGPVRAWVDDEPEFAFAGSLRGQALILEAGILRSRNGASVFRRLGEGRALALSWGGASHRYALRGTFGALAELLGCMLKVRSGEVGFAPQPRPAPPVAAAPPAERPAATAQRPPAPTEPQREPRLRGNGSGVVVTAEGHVLTADHVIQGCRAVRLTAVGGAPVEAAIIGRDPRNDLALLRAATPFPHVASMRMDAVRIGEDVVAYGYPLGGVLATSGNVTFGNVSALVGLRDDSRMLQVSAPLQPGNSGGPLLDGSGLVIGIVQSKLNALNVAIASGDIPQNVNFAVRGSLALSFAQAHAVEPGLERRRPDLPRAEIAALAQRVTLRVLCLE